MSAGSPLSVGAEAPSRCQRRFKTDEYAGLIGGSAFEPHKENPMIGFPGASRYYYSR